ncbi:hypothetical protein BDR03DRAFT_949946, partial [Suillus americanus]
MPWSGSRSNLERTGRDHSEPFSLVQFCVQQYALDRTQVRSVVLAHPSLNRTEPDHGSTK